MIAPGTLCRIVGLDDEWVWMNNRMVTAGDRCPFHSAYFEESYRKIEPKPVADHCCIREIHLQPLSDPDNCTITDADIYARQPETSNAA